MLSSRTLYVLSSCFFAGYAHYLCLQVLTQSCPTLRSSDLGAGYFRAVGGELQYGLSARGLAIDTTRFGSEEFPMFRAFWLQQPRKDDDSVTVLALLDSASTAGAYRFVIQIGRAHV